MAMLLSAVLGAEMAEIVRKLNRKMLSYNPNQTR